MVFILPTLSGVYLACIVLSGHELLLAYMTQIAGNSMAHIARELGLDVLPPGIWSRGIQQEGVDIRGIGRDQRDRRRSLDMDDLDTALMRFERRQRIGLGRVDMRYDLHN